MEKEYSEDVKKLLEAGKEKPEGEEPGEKPAIEAEGETGETPKEEEP